MDTKPEISGIGGWMLIPIISIVATIIFTGQGLIELYPNIGRLMVSIGQSPTSSQTKMAIFLSSIFAVAVIILAAAALIGIFKKSRYAPIIATLYFTIFIIASLIDYWSDFAASVEFNDAPDPEAALVALGSLTFGIIWIAYFQLSKRVRNTFQPHPAASSAPPSDHPVVTDTRAEQQSDDTIS